MINISLDLSNRLPAERVNIIRQVLHVSERLGTDLFIVGAQARDLLLQYAYDLPVHRTTNDIDFGVVIESWNEFTRLREALIGSEKFQSHKTMRQRLIHESGMLIDLVPFGDLEQPSGRIAWPPDFSFVMSTVGFREAYDNSIEVRLADDLMVKVASLAGLALMKIVAWSDRRFERDAQDIGLIMKHYLDAGNQERVIGEGAEYADLLGDNFDYNLASARVLGRDVGKLLSGRSIGTVFAILEEQTGDKNQYPLVNAMLTNFNSDFDTGLGMLESFRQGILDVRQ
jgi:predicted nucleotidyltransferase